MVNVNITKKFLTVNPYSRPATKLNSVKGIVIHWTASPMGRNQGVWNYFERRKSGTNGYGSAHFIVDLDGSIWNCIPADKGNTEMAYHVGSNTYTSEAKKKLGSYPNDSTIGIEFCIVDNRGKMNQSTWTQGALLVAYLLEKFNLTIDDIWTHNSIVGWKDCHRYFVENPNEYKKFKNDIQAYLGGQSTTPPTSTINNPVILGEFYTVKAGDTFWGISQKFNTTVDKLLQLNPSVNPQVLKVGTELRVSEDIVTKYKIQKDDTLWGISRKFNTTVENLKDLNPNVDVNALQIGDYIIVAKTENSLSSDHESILPNKTLRFGDEGEDVKKLQNALNRLYFNVGFADGIFGNATLDALKRYQSMFYNLTADGVFGSTTREHMLKNLLNL